MTILCSICHAKGIIKELTSVLLEKDKASVEIGVLLTRHLTNSHPSELREFGKRLQLLTGLVTGYMLLGFMDIPEDEEYLLELEKKQPKLITDILFPDEPRILKPDKNGAAAEDGE